MSTSHGSSGLAGPVTMQCLTGLPGCVDVDCVCRCHDYASPGEPVCGAVNSTIGLTCNRRPHPPGTAHAQLDDNHVHAWPGERP
ncbi:hypothetical protein [Micromonospora aurantiaca (nom. illeg.)]|uniref:hypothetical protein n=1 Tax=Micromonospora aurantiaca (nom. illeg.) TaxID=47850 RepID=UPI0033C8DBF9